MAWIEQLPSWLSNSIVTVLIAVITGGVAWGIQPAAHSILARIFPGGSRLAAIAVQGLILLGGLALIVGTAGSSALLVLIFGITAFGAGRLLKRPNRLTNHLAPLSFQDQCDYAVGDTVTLGGGYHGVVTAINDHATHLDSAEHGLVILPHSLIVNHPIIIPPADKPYGIDPSLPVVTAGSLPSAKISIHHVNSASNTPTDKSVVEDEPMPIVDPWSGATSQSVEKEAQWAPTLQGVSAESTLASFATSTVTTSAEEEPLYELAQAVPNPEPELVSSERLPEVQGRPLAFSLHKAGLLKKRVGLGKQTIAPLKGMH